LNEELNLPELTRRVVQTFEMGNVKGELVIVDDGSTDSTARVIRELMKQHPGVVVGQFHGANKGIAESWRTGVKAARGTYACVIDSDLQYQPEDIPRLLRALVDYAVDVVQGWRSAVGRERGARFYLSRGFNTLLNTTFGMDLQDNKSGFVMATRDVLEDLLSYEGKYYYWQSFIMVAAKAKGYSYKEVEVLFERRRQGTSFLDAQAYRASFRSLVDLAKAAVEYRVKARRQQHERFEKLKPATMQEAPPPPSPAGRRSLGRTG
jgi:phenylacetate-CoA ligase